MSTGETWTLGRRPALDGLRGLAILLVLAGHGWLPVDFMGAGKIGVGVFFTLSGFLITSLLLEELARTGRIDLPRFYCRRALRLLPAQVTVTTTFALLLGGSLLSRDQIAAAYLYLTNFAPYDGPLGHLWSLAVEEQFYLLWPLLLLGLLRWSKRPGGLSWWLVGLAALSFLGRMNTGDVMHTAVLPLTSDGLLLGAALAVVLHGRKTTVEASRGVCAAAVAGICALGLLPLEPATSWGMTAAGVLTVVAIWCAVQGGSASMLEARLVRWFGERSYALYLWHFPVGVTVTRLGVSEWLPWVLIVAPLSLLLTVASWRYVETPFLRLKSSVPSVRSAPVDRVEARAA